MQSRLPFTHYLLAFAAMISACSPDRTLPTSPETTRPSFERLPVAGGLGFESPTYTAGNINGQDGWNKTGGFDAAVVVNSGTPAWFGSQSLRISNAITSGSFGDQTFSKPLTDEAGETGAYVAIPSGTRESRFIAQWDIMSAAPASEQSGLQLVVSPDKGDGGRMSWVQVADKPTGLEVNFYDYQDLPPYGTPSTPEDGRGPGGDTFVFTTIATGLSRTTSHTVRIEMDLIDGPRNDVVKVFVNGVLRHTGTSWEDYFRWMQCGGCPEPTAPVGTFESRVIRSLLFRTAGTPAPATLGKGFLIDNLVLESTSAPRPTPTTVDLTVTPTTAGLLDVGDNVTGVVADAAPGFSSGSFASGGSTKTDMYFPPAVLFGGRTVTIGDVASMSYWTKTGATHVVDARDWYLVIYTKPYVGDVSSVTWYGDRIGTEPYFSSGLADPAGTWNQWTTTGPSNKLRFFESTQGYFGGYFDPDWNTFKLGNGLSGYPRSTQEILYFSVQTATGWAAGFTGQLDGLRIELTDGSVATVNFEPDPPPDNEAPVVTNVAVSPNPAPYTTVSYSLTATATDNVAVTAASYTVDGGSPVAFSFTAGSPVALSATLGTLGVGVHEICVTAKDAADNTSNTECTMLAVYDPSAGFVTGGGWFMSPAGAYTADAGLVGKASFGFVSKYVKGKTLPTGNTEFQFQAGGLNFSSTVYEWLVVNQAGMNAQFKGEGSLNGVPGYDFMVWAKDGAPDTFRIQITDSSGTVVYDNHQSGTFGTPLGGGNIMIHIPKK